MGQAGEDVEESDDQTSRLRVIFTDRLIQAIDRRPDVIRAGRGRAHDFGDRFSIHYTTAYRLLHGKALPDAELLLRMSEYFGVPAGWFLGQGEYDIDDEIHRSGIKIEIFDPRSHRSSYITIPHVELPTWVDSGRFIYRHIPSLDGGRLGVVVRVSAEPVDGEMHLIYTPDNDGTVLRRISTLKGLEDYICAVSETGGDAVRLKLDECSFGEVSSASRAKYTVIGPVVATLVSGWQSVAVCRQPERG